jgi:alkanesulfonate monooxygenase SsuD/methylene tetrahydromethanopterin reductase-like flavin-dependent oxidoreductase (luciferase family)
MRLGIALEPPDSPEWLVELVRQARAAETNGLDMVWLEERNAGTAHMPAPLAVAAALAGSTSVLRMAACVDAGPHPIELAEEAIVTDLLTGGRLTLVIRSENKDGALLAETVDIVLAATAGRPFRHAGVRWRAPANLRDNTHVEERLVVTPHPAQPELSLWLAGTAAPAVSRLYGVTHVIDVRDTHDAAAELWSQTEQTLGRVARRLRRVALRAIEVDNDGGFDDEALVARLRREERVWGLDLAILGLPSDLGETARLRAIENLASRVRPRIQLDALPRGLERYWRDAAGAGTRKGP